MGIRTHIILAFLGIVLLMAVGGMLVAHRMAEISKAEAISFAKALVRENEAANYRLSEKVLTRYGEFMVQEKAASVATELGYLLKQKKYRNYAELRRNKKIRALATQKIYTMEGVAGYMILFDRHAENIFHPDKIVEGQNYAKWQQQYPEMWKIVKSATVLPKTAGYLTFFDQQGR